MKAAIYVRVSDDRQVDGTSLQSQEDVCRKFCRERGLEVVEVFKDEGESAKTANRPQFQALMVYARGGRISAVVVYKFSRFARNQEDHVTNSSRLRLRGVALLSATEPTGEGPFGRAVEGFMSVFNQLENDIRSENTVRGMKARLSSGRWQWKPPLGYIGRQQVRR